jgi:hypothetical protein
MIGDMNPYESPKHAGYDPPKTVIDRPKWSLAQRIEGWITTGFAAAVVLPTVAFLHLLVTEPGMTRAIWWWVTVPSAAMVAVVIYLAARTARIV